MESFAFIIHPLDTGDIARKFPFTKRLPQAWLEEAMRRLPAFKVSEITGIKSATGAQAKGWFVACPVTSRLMTQLPIEYVLSKISESARLAEKLGAGIVGLGAFTSVVGDAGITVSQNVTIPVTTGNSYTVATALQGIKKAAGLLELDLSQANVAVIGATGSIGKACARIMAKDVKELTLVGRRLEALNQVARDIAGETQVGVHTTLDAKAALRQADVVITVTSAVDTVIEPEDLKSGAIVCDVARPRDVSKKVAEVRDDVLVFEGGVVKVPGDVQFNFNFGFPTGTSYACMAETMILALEGRYESYTLGRELTVEQIQTMAGLAEKHGFTLAGLRSFERAVSEEEITGIRERIKVTKDSLYA